ncbi:hypothetical protein ZIOFF_075187 [Zingiber officinale]|uniref:Uncharacterized protein n=1 Tax=Zingiber officinale TaxID=94328 RepID=A0A8J5BVE7_ZINOF|nr:hypothetical protein ZIOFF_075187 [Zingiber officinale]
MASFSWMKEDVLLCCGSKLFAKELASASPFSDLHHAIQSAYGIWFNKEQSEELAHTFVDQIDYENSCLGYMVSGSKANSASIHQSAAINSSRVVHAQEFDVSVTMLNINIETIEESK